MPVCQQGAVGLSLKEDVLKDVNALPYKPNGFSRNERLQSRSDFEAVYSGKRLFGKYFIQLWVGDGYEIVYSLVLILMVPSTVPLIQNIGIEVQRAKNKHQFRSLIYLLIAIINVVVSIILCKSYGILGVTIGTALADIVGCIIIMNIYYHKKIGINIIAFWKSILRASCGLIIPAVIGALIMQFVHFNNISPKKVKFKIDKNSKLPYYSHHKFKSNDMLVEIIIDWRKQLNFKRTIIMFEDNTNLYIHHSDEKIYLTSNKKEKKTF